MKIRLFNGTDNDYEAVLALKRIDQPEEQLTVSMLRQQDEEMSAENMFARVLGEVDGRVVAQGAYWYSTGNSDEPHQFEFSVLPEFQTGRFPTQLQNHLIAQLEATNPKAIVSEPLSNEQYRVQLLEAAGFVVKMRFLRSQLDVEQFDFSSHEAAAAVLVEQGIELTNLTHVMARDPNWQRHVWRMFTIIDQDVPYPDPQASVPFEEYATYYEGDLFRPDSWAIAIDPTQEGAEQYVGMAVVNIMPTRPDTVYAGISGVVPSHRRRRIATVLKARTVAYAREQGFRYIYTDNEENNPMYGLNLHLGFEPLPAWVYFEKQLTR